MAWCRIPLRDYGKGEEPYQAIRHKIALAGGLYESDDPMDMLGKGEETLVVHPNANFGKQV